MSHTVMLSNEIKVKLNTYNGTDLIKNILLDIWNMF